MVKRRRNTRLIRVIGACGSAPEEASCKQAGKERPRTRHPPPVAQMAISRFARDPRSWRRNAVACALVLMGLLVEAGPASAALHGHSVFGHSHKKVCGSVSRGMARCHAQVVTDAESKPLVTST